MANALIIVESPTKVKTLSKFLGSEYTIKASVGHIKDLPSNRLGVDITHEFLPEYITIEGKEKVLTEIKKAAKKVEKIFLAPDPDREGEAISWHIANELMEQKGNYQIYRVLFNEITKKAVLQALANPGQIDQGKVDAQQARRVLDRLVGYQISPILWRKVRWGLSAGRVQSVAVRLICEREREIQAFVAEEYWTITAHLKAANPPPFTAKLFRIAEQKANLTKEEESTKIVEDLKGQEFLVTKVDKKRKKKHPVAPFTTSKLQQESFRKLHFSAKKTMVIAQRLYEGIELGDEGSVGLITYMRTDSTRVSEESLSEAREYIVNRFGQEYLPSQVNRYKNKNDAQDAHEAVRPTSVMREPEKIKGYLKSEEFLLYQLIWQRFIASQMNEALIDQTTVDLKALHYIFRATGSVTIFKGFSKLYEEGSDDEPSTSKDEGASSSNQANELPPLSEGEKTHLQKLEPKQHFTQPPPRYSDATLVKELEEKGIGRPSTYATILGTIVNREYVDKDKKGRFSATELGLTVNDLLVDNFPEVLNVEFTAQMETSLDEVEEGKRDWVKALKSFYDSFNKYVKRAESNMKNVKREGILTEIDCDKCGKKMAIKWGRNGEFLSCTGYPACKNAKEFTRGENGEILIKKNEVADRKCEKCGSPMVLKHSRFGSFLACSGYPACKNTISVAALEKPTEDNEAAKNEKCDKCGSPMQIKVGPYGRFLSCTRYPECKFIKPINIGICCPQPDCKGYLTERKSKQGRTFYSCSNYPECNFSIWQKPIAEKCPKCNFPFLTQAKNKLVCGNKECDYSQEN